MKKIFLTVIVALLSLSTNAQIVSFGLKAGANLTQPSSIKNTVSNPSTLWDAHQRAGFTGGLFLKVKPGILGLFAETEILYSNFKVEMKEVNGSEKFVRSTNKFEVPVHVGISFLKFIQVYTGPSFNFLSDGKINTSDIKFDEVKKSVTTSGDLGARVMLGKISLDARYQFNFSNKSTTFGDRADEMLHSYKTNPSMFYLTLGYSIFGK